MIMDWHHLNYDQRWNEQSFDRENTSLFVDFSRRCDDDLSMLLESITAACAAIKHLLVLSSLSAGDASLG
jgi:hypothetical protein